MKKSKLEIAYTYDFKLLGVIAAAKAYKLAWELNSMLHINLVKQPDLVVGFKNSDEKSFSFYSFETQLNRLQLFKKQAFRHGFRKVFFNT